MSKKKQPRENYLLTPNHIRNLNLKQKGLCRGAISLLAHFYSFGTKGCFQSNEILGKMHFTATRTISRWIAELKAANLIQIKSPKGYYRTIWVKSHPDVIEAAMLWYRGEQIPKADKKSPLDLDNNGEHHSQKWRSELAKNGIGLSQKCPTTNNKTIKETKNDTTAMPTPLPAGGQASALLTDRVKEDTAQVETFKKGFGAKKKKWIPPTKAEQDKRKQKMKEQLSAK